MRQSYSSVNDLLKHRHDGARDGECDWKISKLDAKNHLVLHLGQRFLKHGHDGETLVVNVTENFPSLAL